MRISLLLLSYFAPQIMQQVVNTPTQTAAVVTPTPFGIHSGSSTETNAVGSRAAGTVTCAANAYCISLPQASLAGNAIVVFVKYSSASTKTVTPTDDQSNTYTHCSSEAHDATNNFFADAYYVLNATTSSRVITLTFGSSGATHVSALAMQLNDLASFDACAVGSSATTVSTYSTGSVTPAQANDEFVSYVANTITTTNTGTFVKGSQTNITWTKGASDRRDGQAMQYGQYTTTTALNPQFTTGTSNGYVGVTMAFKTGSQGTAPTGMYIIAEQHQTSVSGGSGNLVYDAPSSGANLLYAALQCGGTTPMTVSSISDGTNTWIQSGNPGSFPAGLGWNASFYAENVSGSDANTNTYTTAGTGDCSVQTYAIAGAATHPFTAHAAECGGENFSSSHPQCADGTTDIPGASSVTPLAINYPIGYFPGHNSGLTIMSWGLGFNTAIGCTAPTGCAFDADTSGGENISGPWPVDQNNFLSNVATSNNNALTFTSTMTSASTDIQFGGAVLDSFASATATILPTLVQSVECTSTASGGANSTTTCAITPHNTGNMLAIMLASGSAGTGNITVSDGASNTIVAGFPISGTAATNVTNGSFRTYYIASLNATTSDTFTVTWATSTTYRTIYLMELRGVTALDIASNGTTTSGAAGAFNSVSVTTGTANEILVGANLCSGACNQGTTVNMGSWDGTGNGTTFAGQESVWKVLTSSGSGKTLAFIDNAGTGHTEGTAVMAFK